jgi:hypothetical protein
MSLEVALTRMAQLQSMFAAPAVTQAPAPTTTTASNSSFATQLQSASAASLTGTPAPAGTAGQAIVNLVRNEIGPWCAYFTSWAAREAGVPLGDNGQGFGRVDDVYAWAQKAGKAVPNGEGVTPQPGDLIVWDEHIGVVESVGADGTINTIEGNSSDKVSQRSYAPGSRPAIGYVRLG